jgi:hypothetical protein
MLGGKNVKVKIDRDLYDRVRKIADVAGYADDDIRERLKGLGYIS